MTDTTVNEETQAEAPQESAPGGLTIQDLRVLKDAIDIASKRGGFQANEFTTVGNTFNRLSMFLAQLDAKNEENSNETAETAEE